jgi:hypothetical protein
LSLAARYDFHLEDNMLDRLFQFLDLQRSWEERYVRAKNIFERAGCFAGYFVDLYRMKEKTTLFQRTLALIARPLARLAPR